MQISIEISNLRITITGDTTPAQVGDAIASALASPLQHWQTTHGVIPESPVCEPSPEAAQSPPVSPPAEADPGKRAVNKRAKPGKSGRKAVRIVCQEKPGELLSYEDAAKLTGTSYSGVSSRLCKQQGDWITIRGYHFRREGAGDPAPSPPFGDAVPRHSNGTSTPRNPNVIGPGASMRRSAEPASA